MKISAFITQNMEQILLEWEAFAATFGAVADKMSASELRDHAKQILEFVAKDVEIAETAREVESKSRGLGDLNSAEETASSVHGAMRYTSGFTLLQLIAEYRALRASVLKLWQRDCADISTDSAQDTMRFNEAVDQSLAEAAVAYSDKLNQTRETFIAILGHDLRSALAATSTAGSYLARPGAFPEQVQQIGIRVKRSAATMSRMVNDLLALARTQLGDGIPIYRKQCDMLEVCQWAVEDASAAHPRSQFAINATGELLGNFDAPRLQQLLSNLTNNAAQHGKTGTPIAVSVAGEENDIVMQVINQGTVISEDRLLSVFDSLVQLPSQENDRQQHSSLGLGLFIAKQITMAHGGTIHAQSDEVNGTVFTVRIPREA